MNIYLSRTIVLLAAFSCFSLYSFGQKVSQSRMDLLDDLTALESGDILIYEVLEEKEPPTRLRIDNEGFLNPPLLGKISTSGLTAKQLAYQIKELLEVDYFYRATVLVEKDLSISNKKVTILGEVNSPGVQPLPADRNLSLSDIILQAGGFSRDADKENIELIRTTPEGKEERLTIDLSNVFERGERENDITIMANDLIIISRKTKSLDSVYVIGSVLQPGYVQINSEEKTVSKAILEVGGFTKFANKKNVKLIRTNPTTNEKETFTINVQKILEDGERTEDMILQADDIIRVEERWIVF